MGCGGNRRSEPRVVQIGVVRAKKANPQSVAIEKTPKTEAVSEPLVLAPTVQDFHCEDCGLTLQRRTIGYHHKCQGERSIDYQDQRRSICGGCVHNENGVCLELKKVHPDRDCLISVGVKMAIAYCTLGLWDRAGKHCEFCGAFNFFIGPSRCCKYCGRCKVAN